MIKINSTEQALNSDHWSSYWIMVHTHLSFKGTTLKIGGLCALCVYSSHLKYQLYKSIILSFNCWNYSLNMDVENHSPMSMISISKCFVIPFRIKLKMKMHDVHINSAYKMLGFYRTAPLFNVSRFVNIVCFSKLNSNVIIFFLHTLCSNAVKFTLPTYYGKHIKHITDMCAYINMLCAQSLKKF